MPTWASCLCAEITHAQGKTSSTEGPSPFALNVFDVYKTVYETPKKTPKRKERVVVEIRGLDQLTISDNTHFPFGTTLSPLI